MPRLYLLPNGGINWANSVQILLLQTRLQMATLICALRNVRSIRSQTLSKFMRHFEFSVMPFSVRANIQIFRIAKLVLPEFPVFWPHFPRQAPATSPVSAQIAEYSRVCKSQISSVTKSVQATGLFGRNIMLRQTVIF